MRELKRVAHLAVNMGKQRRRTANEAGRHAAHAGLPDQK